VLSSQPGMRTPPDLDTFRGVRDQKLPVYVSMTGEGNGNDLAHVICGFLSCDARPFNPLLSALPPVLHARGGGASDSVLRRLAELAVRESNTPRAGSDCALARLSELMFVEVVRQHVESLPTENTGWFAGLRDEVVGRALQELHDRPSDSWSLEGLAKEVGVSRSVLAERFVHFVGVPPIQYLTDWRIQLAASLLHTSNWTLAEIAGRVGYGSEAALSRAFKRRVGIAPTAYRRGERASSLPVNAAPVGQPCAPDAQSSQSPTVVRRSAAAVAR